MKAPEQQRIRVFGRAAGGRRQLRCCASPQALAAPQDAFIAQALKASGNSNSVSQSLYQQRLPTRKVESYRFTDLSPLQQQQLQAPPALDASVARQAAQQCMLDASGSARLVIMDGQLCEEASDTSGLPDGVFAGSADSAPASTVQHAGVQASERGGIFAEINTATARSRIAVHVPKGVRCNTPLHIVYASSAAHEPQRAVASAPQLLIVCEEGASLEVIEECVPSDAGATGAYFVNAVVEAVLHEGARLQHRFLEREARSAFHMRATLVSQQQDSSYSLVEARLGGTLTRHDVGVQQLGTGTHTELRHFVLCGDAQLHDLHTSLILDHEGGTAQQLHKCIVASGTGHGVFDGNVQVNTGAQQTDAGQLSRNLLLVPRATVNVKPNLQIIADDVACTHGCAVSDLSASELFYFRSRGIDADEARRALVFSFGAEVLQGFGHEQLVSRAQDAVAATLRSVV